MPYAQCLIWISVSCKRNSIINLCFCCFRFCVSECATEKLFEWNKKICWTENSIVLGQFVNRKYIMQIYHFTSVIRFEIPAFQSIESNCSTDNKQQRDEIRRKENEDDNRNFRFEIEKCVLSESYNMHHAPPFKW